MSNKHFKYGFGEDLANSISHGVGIVLAIIALIKLTYTASVNGTITDVIAFSLYGVSLILMFSASTIYHAVRSVKVKYILRKIDHSMVYILIIGTYTPFVFTVLKSDISYVVYSFLALLTIIGIVYKSIFVHKFKILSTIIYVIMGWLSLMLITGLVNVLPKASIYFLLMGGVIYTVGALFYMFSKFKYNHLIWHMFVLAAAVSHYISITYYVF